MSRTINTVSWHLNVLFVLFSLLFSISCKSHSTSPGTFPGETNNAWELKYQLANGMTIDVFIPADYDENKTYPLLILNDGEQMFGNGSWSLDLKLNELIRNGDIEPIIAVAIYSNGSRNNWYIPYEDSWITQNWGAYSPQAHQYASDVINVVLPFVEELFPYNKDRVGILGASLGGLVSTWMGLKYPDTITYSASLSGSFWVADYRIFTEVSESYRADNRFWFDIGTAEWNYYVPLYSSLDQAGVKPGLQNFYYEVPDAQHTPIDWMNRIHHPLKIFFGHSDFNEIEAMEVVLECIPSQSVPGRKFRRLNPIVTLSSGVKYSLAHTATYSVLDGEAELGSEGSFRNNPETIVKILIQYQSLSQQVVIPIGWCE